MDWAWTPGMTCILANLTMINEDDRFWCLDIYRYWSFILRSGQISWTCDVIFRLKFFWCWNVCSTDFQTSVFIHLSSSASRTFLALIFEQRKKIYSQILQNLRVTAFIVRFYLQLSQREEFLLLMNQNLLSKTNTTPIPILTVFTPTWTTWTILLHIPGFKS